MPKLLRVKVKPNAKKEGVKQIDDTRFEVRVKEPPKEGKANRAAITLLAQHFHTAPSRITIVAGTASKEKVIEIKDGSI